MTVSFHSDFTFPCFYAKMIAEITKRNSFQMHWLVYNSVYWEDGEAHVLIEAIRIEQIKVFLKKQNAQEYFLVSSPCKYLCVFIMMTSGSLPFSLWPSSLQKQKSLSCSLWHVCQLQLIYQPIFSKTKSWTLFFDLIIVQYIFKLRQIRTRFRHVVFDVIHLLHSKDYHQFINPAFNVTLKHGDPSTLVQRRRRQFASTVTTLPGIFHCDDEKNC